MRPLVLDASTTLASLLQDERSSYAVRVIAVLKEGATVFVPSHWWIESLNGMVMAERRGRISSLELTEIVDELQSMPVTTDEETISRGVGDTLHLARLHRLTVYDAAYLELALRRRATLATEDKALAKAAKSAGVSVLA